MSTRRAVLVVGALAIVVAACTTEQASDPRPTLPPATTGVTTTTTVPPSTTTSTTTTSTTVAPTTEPEPTAPPLPVDAVVPLFAGSGEGGWLYLGAWQFDQWTGAFESDGQPITPTIAVGQPATVSNLGNERTGAFGEPSDSCFDDRTGPTIDIDVAPPEPPGFGYAAIALPTPEWTLTPRPVAVTATGPETYLALGRDAFAGESVDPAVGAVEQVVVTDLDGDGDDEALVVFEGVQPDAITGAPGDLAAVLLVDTGTRQASTVERSFVPSDLGVDGFPIIERFRVIAVADLNGDGMMEVAVHSWYYEGASVIVYRYDGAELVEVAASGCGA